MKSLEYMKHHPAYTLVYMKFQSKPYWVLRHERSGSDILSSVLTMHNSLEEAMMRLSQTTMEPILIAHSSEEAI